MVASRAHEIGTRLSLRMKESRWSSCRSPRGDIQEGEMEPGRFDDVKVVEDRTNVARALGPPRDRPDDRACPSSLGSRQLVA